MRSSSFLKQLNVFVVAFAASAGVAAAATYGDFRQLAVASAVVMSARIYVAGNITIEVFHD